MFGVWLRGGLLRLEMLEEIEFLGYLLASEEASN